LVLEQWHVSLREDADLVLVKENTTYSDMSNLVSGFFKHLNKMMMSVNSCQNVSGKGSIVLV